MRWQEKKSTNLWTDLASIFAGFQRTLSILVFDSISVVSHIAERFKFDLFLTLESIWLCQVKQMSKSVLISVLKQEFLSVSPVGFWAKKEGPDNLWQHYYEPKCSELLFHTGQVSIGTGLIYLASLPRQTGEDWVKESLLLFCAYLRTLSMFCWIKHLARLRRITDSSRINSDEN